MTAQNHDRIGKALRLLNHGLYSYAEQQMQKAYQQDWLLKAQSSLRGYPQERTIEETLREDVSALLTMISRQWDKAFKQFLSRSERAIVSELIEVRNQWAHGSSFSTENTHRALDSMTRLLTAIAAPEAEAVDQLRQEAFKLHYQEQVRPEIRRNQLSAKEQQICNQLSGLLAKIPFNNPLLLYRALTHRSYMYEHPTETMGDNEQLEFLGDSVLEFLSGDYFYQRYPDRKEDELTKRRSNLVENANLAKLATTWDLGRWMLLGRGEELTGGRTRPSLLSNMFEAVIGSYYLDSGIEAVRTLVTPLFDAAGELPKSNSAPTAVASDPKGQLQHYALTQHKQPPIYVVTDESGPDHAKTFTVNVLINNEVYGTGTGANKKEAEKQAAIAALKLLVLFEL